MAEHRRRLLVWLGVLGDNGKRHGPADGTPAYQAFYPDGTPKVVERWTNGKFVSEERFPPIGEA